MSALVGLGLRLARAGGRLRAWSIAGGNAVGVVLLLVALAVPAALYPDPGDRTASRFQVLGAMTLLLVPAAVLLVTVGRLSSGVRDRRLATLRMLGVSKRQVRAAAAVENAVLALLGTLAGTALFTVAAPAVADVAGFAGPLRASPAVSAGAVAAVMALSALVGTAATWNRTLPGAARSAATRRTPGRWRLVPLAVGVAALAWQATVDVERTSDDLQIAALLGGTATTAVGIALATPLATAWLAGRLTRRRSLALLLAGRAVQTDSAGAARVVAGLGVALFLSVGALGELGAFQNAPQYRYAVQAYGAGPQQIDVATGTGEAGPLPTFSSDDLASLSAVPGVLGLAPDHWLRATAGDRSVLPVFTGICAELALVVEAAGCDDSRAARIEPDTRDLAGADWLWFPDASVLADATEVASSVVDVDDRGDRRRVDLSGPPIVEHTGEQVGRWVWPTGYLAFVPRSLVADVVGRPSHLLVVATGGTPVQQRVAAWARERGYASSPYPRGEYDDMLAMRTAVGSLSAVVVGVALLILALAAADRASERRPSVARQVAIGVPARVLRAGQLLQTLLPTAVAALLALGCGALALRAFAHTIGMASLVDAGTWRFLVAAVGVGAVLVALTTVPLIRTRLTPDLLRRE